MSTLPRDLVDKLDLVYLFHRRDVPPITDIYDKDINKFLRIDDVSIFAAVLTVNPVNSFYPSPVLSFGQPETEEYEISGRKGTRYHGLHPLRIKKGILTTEREWESAVDVRDDGRAQIYNGLGDFIDTVMFDEPLTFDLTKRLVYVRSPNGSIIFDDVLHTTEAQEGRNSPLAEYVLVHANLDDLKQGLWARSDPFRLGLHQEYNPHLIE